MTAFRAVFFILLLSSQYGDAFRISLSMDELSVWTRERHANASNQAMPMGWNLTKAEFSKINNSEDSLRRLPVQPAKFQEQSEATTTTVAPMTTVAATTNAAPTTTVAKHTWNATALVELPRYDVCTGMQVVECNKCKGTGCDCFRPTKPPREGVMLKCAKPKIKKSKLFTGTYECVSSGKYETAVDYCSLGGQVLAVKEEVPCVGKMVMHCKSLQFEGLTGQGRNTVETECKKHYQIPFWSDPGVDPNGQAVQCGLDAAWKKETLEIDDYPCSEATRCTITGGLLPKSLEYQAVKHIFESSYKDRWTRDRAKIAGGPVPRGYEVQTVIKINSFGNQPTLGVAYEAYKSRIKDYIKSQAGWQNTTDEFLGSFIPNRDLKPADGKPSGHRQVQPYTALVNFCSTKKQGEIEELQRAGLTTDQSVNEVLVFHSTNAMNLGNLVEQGLIIREDVPGGLFGGGNYFAEFATKCDEYARPVVNLQDFHVAFMAKVALGNYDYQKEESSGYTSKTAAWNRLRLQAHKDQPVFHSVLGDREKVRDTFREFVVYENDAVQLLWMITYKRL